MRQFAVNDKAIPPLLNDDINCCDRCNSSWRHTKDPESLCSHHRDAMMRYAREIGAPSPLKRGGTRIHYTAHVTEDAPEYDLSRLHDKQQQRLGSQ